MLMLRLRTEIRISWALSRDTFIQNKGTEFKPPSLSSVFKSVLVRNTDRKIPQTQECEFSWVQSDLFGKKKQKTGKLSTIHFLHNEPQFHQSSQKTDGLVLEATLKSLFET